MEKAQGVFSERNGQDWNSAEIQALLWYFEKAVHDRYGSKQTDDSPDYASAANGLFRRERGSDARAFEPSDAVRGRKLPGGSVEQLEGEATTFEASAASIDLKRNSFSIARTDVTPTANTRTFLTQQGGLVGPATFSMRGYHGTLYKVGRFSAEKIGTAEGA